MKSLTDYFKEKASIAISIDGDSEYFVIKPLGTVLRGKTELGNTLGEFIEFDFNEFKTDIEYIYNNNLFSSDNLSYRFDSNCNPGRGIGSSTMPYVNLFLFPLFSELFYESKNNLPIDKALKLIEKYNSIQPKIKKLYINTLSLPNDKKIFDEYNRYINSTNSRPLSCKGETKFMSVFNECDDMLCFFPESITDMMNYLLIQYIKRDLHFRTCKFCDRPFALIKKYNSDFCNRSIYDTGQERTCKNYGKYLVYGYTKTPNPIPIIKRNPIITKQYTKAYKTHHARIRNGKMTQEQFTAWVTEAKEKRNDALSGKMSTEDFINWLESDLKINKKNNH